MKKLLIALSALGAIATSNAEIVKVVNPTKAQQELLEGLSEEPLMFSYPTNKGIMLTSLDFGYQPPRNVKVSDCLKFSGFAGMVGWSYYEKTLKLPIYKNVKQVKCPKNLQGKQ